MFLKSLNLKNFRSYKKREFIFSGKATLIVGHNAVGKTNILEAVYLLARGKSFRADLDREMISYGEELGRVEGKIVEALRSPHDNLRVFNSLRENTFGKNEVSGRSQAKTYKLCEAPRTVSKSTDLEIILTSGQIQGKKTLGKLFKVNGVGRHWKDFVGSLKVVLFRPEDSEIILGSPSKRREYLDSVLEQVDLDYRRSNLVYKKGLRQRNKLLDRIREGQANRTQLEYWNRLIIKNGEIITKKREELIEYLNNQFSPPAGGENYLKKNLSIEYDRSVISQERLEKYAQIELAVGATMVGPHRDEIKFRFKDQDLSVFGSRGEQRMAVLALKLAELEFIGQIAGERPILLLDDIFSELDEEHRGQVLATIDKQQTLITTTETHFVSRRFLDKMEIINL